MPRYQLQFTLTGVCEIDAIDPDDARESVMGYLHDLDSNHLGIPHLSHVTTFSSEATVDGEILPNGVLQP